MFLDLGLGMEAAWVGWTAVAGDDRHAPRRDGTMAMGFGGMEKRAAGSVAGLARWCWG